MPIRARAPPFAPPPAKLRLDTAPGAFQTRSTSRIDVIHKKYFAASPFLGARHGEDDAQIFAPPMASEAEPRRGVAGLREGPLKRLVGATADRASV